MHWEIFLDYSLLITLLVLLLLVLLLAFYKKRNGGKATGKLQKTAKQAPSKPMSQPSNKKVDDKTGGGDWVNEIDKTISDDDNQEWQWDSHSGTGSVSTQEVDLLTEYQVYKQFGYEDKAATSLASYLNSIPTSEVSDRLVHELLNLSLHIEDLSLLEQTLNKYRELIPADDFSEYIKSGLKLDPTNLSLRVLAENSLGWGVKEVSTQIGEKDKLEEVLSPSDSINENDKQDDSHVSSTGTRSPIVIGHTKQDLGFLSEDEISAVIGFSRSDKSAKLLGDKVDYDTALQQYDRAINSSSKPASLLIDALKLDYQYKKISQFAKHLWELYDTLGQYGRQVKERMLGWGYNLGNHGVFDKLEKNPNENQIHQVGVDEGYIQSSMLKLKSKYRDLVVKDDSIPTTDISPSEAIIKEVESLLMYGQSEQAIDVLEKNVLKYPEESQLYVILFDLYERTEDWYRLQQFLRTLREQVNNLPEEMILAMSRLLRKVNEHVKR